MKEAVEVSEETKIDLSNDNEYLYPIDKMYVNETYINLLRKTKSIYENKDWGGLLGFRIIQNTHKDSIQFKGFVVNEGGYDCILQNVNTTYKYNPLIYKKNLFPFRFDSLTISKEKILMYNTDTSIVKYVQINSLDSLYNEIILSGTYSSTLNDTLKFYSNGNIEGIPNMTTYKIVSNFSGGIFFDCIMLYDSKGNRKHIFKYQFGKQKLLLFDVEANFEDANIKVGDLIYSLIKID